MGKKNRSKSRGLGGQGATLPTEAPIALRPDWDSIEIEFFAREADLYRISPVESFDDLDAAE